MARCSAPDSTFRMGDICRLFAADVWYQFSAANGDGLLESPEHFYGNGLSRTKKNSDSGDRCIVDAADPVRSFQYVADDVSINIPLRIWDLVV